MRFTVALTSALLGTSLLVLAERPAQAQTKVAIIDMVKAINETNEGARANDTLKKYYDKRQGELNGKQEELLKEKNAIEKRCRSLPPAQCQSSMEELQKKLMELQGLMGQYQQDIQKRQSETTQPMLTKMLAIVGRLARQNGYDMVVDRAATHFSLPASDITDQAIKLYNTESPAQPLPAGGTDPKGGKDKKPAPAPAPKK